MILTLSYNNINIRFSHRGQKQLYENEREEEWGLSSAAAGLTTLQKIKEEFSSKVTVLAQEQTNNLSTKKQMEIWLLLINW